jgi:hypothetical protein
LTTSPPPHVRVPWQVARETTRISANGIPNLSTSVVVPGGLPRAIPVSAILLQEGCYPLQVSPRTPAQYKVGGLYENSHSKQGQLTIGPYGAESEHSSTPSHTTRPSGKRPDRIFPRQPFTSNQVARSRQNTARRYAPRTHARTHQDTHISVQAQNTIHNQATKVWIVEVRD